MDPVLNRALVDVEYVDGTKSRYELRAMTIRQLYQFCTDYAEARGIELVALCTGQPVEMIDRLTVDSFAKLYDAIFAANFEKAMTLAQRDPSIAAKLVPAVMKAHEALIQFTSIVRSGSATPSPEPAQSASAVAIGSGSSTSPQPASKPSSELTASSKPSVT